MEALTYARLNSQLWVDIDHQKNLSSVMAYPEDLRECDIGSVMTTLRYSSHPAMPDQLDVFLRNSFLPHADEYKRWSMVAGVAPGAVEACPVDGLYEIERGGLKRIVALLADKDGVIAVDGLVVFD